MTTRRSVPAPPSLAESTSLDAHDRAAFLDATLKLQRPKAVFDAFHAFVTQKYQLGPLDSVDAITGVITRVVPDPIPNPTPSPDAPGQPAE